ncbi:MAG: hypothetical protein ACPG52_07895 [Cognaticolwellia sp.]
MARIKPVLDASSPEPRPQLKVSRVSDEKYWTFSFRFFKQIEFFGLDGANTNAAWFSSLLARLQDLSDKKLSEFLTDSAAQGKSGYRFHQINWSQKNIPVQRADINWLPIEYLQNDTEFPFFQFQISKSNGRIIGFFDENWHFNVLLLDPLHNMQPSKSHGYSVDPCSPLSCDYTSLNAKFVALNEADCSSENCGYKTHLNDWNQTSTYTQNVILHFIESDMALTAQSHIDNGKAESFTDIFESGVVYLDD